jgi:hypothetical protein
MTARQLNGQVAASINGENHGDEEDNWAQDCADGAQNCPQDGPRYSQDGTESSPRYSQDWTESGPRYSQDGTEGGACCPQDSAKAYIANSIANDKAGSPPPRYRTDRIRYSSVRLTRRRGFAVPFGERGIPWISRNSISRRKAG